MNDHGVSVGVSVGEPISWPARWDRDGRPTALPTLSDRGGDVKDINNAGFAVGTLQTSGGFGHAAMWTPEGALVDLGARHPELPSYAGAINDRGAVAGHVDGRATLWRPDGRAVTLPAPPSAVWTFAEGIADDDTVIGRTRLSENGPYVPIRWDGRDHRYTVYPHGTFLSEVTGRGWVAGSSTPAGARREYGTVWNPSGRMTAISRLPGGSISWATDVNRHGIAVGWGDMGGSYRAIRWDRSGNATELPGPADVRMTTATDIADDGTVVGYSEVHSYPPGHRALRWDRFGNVTELGTLPGTRGVMPIAVNNRGMVLGIAHDGIARPRAVLWR